MPTLFASSEKNVQWIKVVTNDSIGKCSSELYSFNLLKLPPPPRAAILVYNQNWLGGVAHVKEVVYQTNCQKKYYIPQKNTHTTFQPSRTRLLISNIVFFWIMFQYLSHVPQSYRMSWFIPLRIPENERDWLLLRGFPESQATNPNHQFRLSWSKMLGKYIKIFSQMVVKDGDFHPMVSGWRFRLFSFMWKWTCKQSDPRKKNNRFLANDDRL